MNRRSWIAVAVIVLVQVLAFSALTSVALRFPGMGAASFMMAMAVVCYASIRHPLATAIILALMNALMLTFYAQSMVLPTALVLLLVTGIIPYITQLSHGLSRLALATTYAGGCLLLSLGSWGSAMTGVGDLAGFVLCSLLAGLACSIGLIRKPASGHV